MGDGTLTQADFTNLWTQLATALVGTPGLVGYGLMNEPSALIPSVNLLTAPNGLGGANNPYRYTYNKSGSYIPRCGYKSDFWVWPGVVDLTKW